MGEMKPPSEFGSIAPSAEGLFFSYCFDANGFRCDEPQADGWLWRSYVLSDQRARQAIATDAALPADARQALLASAYDSHIDLDDDWLHGDLPDLRHDYSVEARGLGHFRFAFNDKLLVGGRRRPLDSVERVRRFVEARTRPYKSPGAVIEAIIGESLDGMNADILKLGDVLDGIEDRIVCDAWHNERQALVDVRRQLVAIHRQMATLTGLFRHLDHAHRHDLSEPLSDMVARLSHRTYALHHDSEQLQARARLLQDELMAKLSEQSNRLLYFLSVMTAVLLPMTIISGLFGMNVGGVPFLQNGEGFWIVSVVSIVVAVSTLYAVKRLGRGS